MRILPIVTALPLVAHGVRADMASIMANNPLKMSAYPDPGELPPAPGLDRHRQAIVHGEQ